MGLNDCQQFHTLQLYFQLIQFSLFFSIVLQIYFVAFNNFIRILYYILTKRSCPAIPQLSIYIPYASSKAISVFASLCLKIITINEKSANKIFARCKAIKNTNYLNIIRFFCLETTTKINYLASASYFFGQNSKSDKVCAAH